MSQATEAPVAGEWARSWPVVLACALGLSVSAVAPYAMGQFMPSLEHAFGWSRAEASAGLSVGVVFGFVFGPLVGRLIDRTNARLVALPGLVLGGLGLAGLSLANGDPTQWLALWCLHAFVSILVGPPLWVAVIAGSFNKQRSLAMAIALMGTALGATFVPMLARYLIDTYEWRAAFQLLGACWFGAVLLICIPLLIDRRVRGQAATEKSALAVTPMFVIFRSPGFLRLAFVVLAGSTVIAANIIHLAPAMVDHGFAPREAAKLAGIAGVSVIFGKLLVGSLFDRLPMGVVSTGVLGVLALASFLLATLNGQTVLAIAACGAVGMSSGALMTFVACATARLYKAQDFGVAFGALMSMLSLGGGVGPLLAGFVHDQFGAYTVMNWGGAAVALISAAALFTLPSTPLAERQPA